jgi:hypothetical protein
MWSDIHFSLAIQCMSATLTFVVAPKPRIKKPDMTPLSRHFMAVHEVISYPGGTETQRAKAEDG